MSFSKAFFFGLGAGAALTMVALEMWGRYLERGIVLNANPWILQPFRQHAIQEMPKSSDKLPRPVLPTATSAAHDHWTIHPLDGKPATLGDFKGKVVFLSFWSTSCQPCIAEMPGIERLQESLRSEPVAFLAVTQEDEQSVRIFLQKVPLHLSVYLAGNDTPEDFGPQVVPRTFILDRSGREVFRTMGGLNWDDENARKFIRGLEAQ
jgi:thiol-disulfide isomerase/thioredoxin